MISACDSGQLWDALTDRHMLHMSLHITTSRKPILNIDHDRNEHDGRPIFIQNWTVVASYMYWQAFDFYLKLKIEARIPFEKVLGEAR